MGNKNKTISFRVNEDSFETLREIAERRDLSLSAVFRDYVDMLVSHDGRVRVVPENEIGEETDGSEFPPTVEVPKSFVREHERLELEAEHLREQLQEYKQYANRLKTEVEDHDDVEEVVQLEELDDELDTDETYRIG
jgi:hypothetical protein